MTNYLLILVAALALVAATDAYTVVGGSSADKDKLLYDFLQQKGMLSSEGSCATCETHSPTRHPTPAPTSHEAFHASVYNYKTKVTYWFYDSVYFRKEGDEIVTKVLRQSWHAHLPHSPDAVVFEGKNYYFFKGSQYWKIKSGGNSVSGPHSYTDTEDWGVTSTVPGMHLPANLDCAFLKVCNLICEDGFMSHYHFFKGDQWWTKKKGSQNLVHHGTYDLSTRPADMDACMWVMGPGHSIFDFTDKSEFHWWKSVPGFLMHREGMEKPFGTSQMNGADGHFLTHTNFNLFVQRSNVLDGIN